MSESIALETRLEAVERDVAKLKHLVGRASETRPWYERTVGSMKDYPEFAEVVRLGRELRKAEQNVSGPKEQRVIYVLDTDYVVLLQRGTGNELHRVLQRMALHPDTAFFYPVIAFHEQMLGANAYIAQARKREDIVRGYDMLHRVLTDFSLAQVLPFDDPAARKFEELRSQRVRVGTMDLRIASIAMSRGMTVLTRNLVDFQAIPGLVVEDWTIG